MNYRGVAILTGLALAALTAAPARARVWYSGQSSSGAYEIELVSHGLSLPAYHLRGHTYVEGRMGERYAVRIHNRTWQRVEAVISVDGRDAIDGQPASLSKRGYVIPPYSHVDVDGFRLSMHEVAAFRFTSVPDSYASRMGSPWKVGVVGVAIFPERVRRPPPPPPPRPPYTLGDRRAGPDDWDGLEGRAGAERESSAARSAPGYYPRQRNLGTQFGERRASPVSETSFTRQNWSAPAARLSLRYDDREGLCALGIGAFCYPSYPPYPPPPPPYYPPERFSDPPPGWDHFSPWY